MYLDLSLSYTGMPEELEQLETSGTETYYLIMFQDIITALYLKDHISDLNYILTRCRNSERN